MKRSALILLFLALLLLELWILESFLPYAWRHPVSGLFDRISPSQPYPPHNIGLEFEMFLRDHLLAYRRLRLHRPPGNRQRHPHFKSLESASATTLATS